LFYHVDGEQNEMIAIWGNNKKDGQCQNTLWQLEKLKMKNGWKMEMCQKQTQCPFLKNGCFSVVFHLISGSIFHPIFLKNEIKNEIKNGSKMRTVNTPNKEELVSIHNWYETKKEWKTSRNLHDAWLFLWLGEFIGVYRIEVINVEVWGYCHWACSYCSSQFETLYWGAAD